MPDPFSSFSAALSVVDVGIRVGKYLRTVRRNTKNAAEEITSLEAEIETFTKTYEALGTLCVAGAAQHQHETKKSSEVEDPCAALWRRATSLVEEGQSLVGKLKEILEDILGNELSPRFQKINDVRRAIRMSSRSNEYDKLRARFTKLNLELNTMLTAIDLTSNSMWRSKELTSVEQLPWNLSQKLQDLGVLLKRQIEALENNDADAQPSITSAKAAIDFASLNEHFYVQKPDASLWTGRTRYLDQLRDAILSSQPGNDRMQKRFVVHGIPGAGKTQFCCKFAQDYRESFWGIFWLDASSEQNARESWKRIAKIGGKDSNEEAGKYWLSNLQSPWLLIIDGADRSEESIRSQFPSGERGCVLITTRNPRLTVNATVGSLALNRLEENEASELLRKATDHTPWDGSARTSASSIADHLGYLPLALIHAGRAIFHRLCTLHGYIPYFNTALNNLREKRHLSISVDGCDDDEDDDDGMGAFTTFDIIYSGLEAQTNRKTTSQTIVSKDAIELINIVAFLHHTDINLDIFVKAGRNLQQAVEIGARKEESPGVTPSFSARQWVENLTRGLYMRFLRPVPVLPQVLHTTGGRSFDESRARKAIDLLVRMSLLSESSERGTYSMHPLVHVWVRKRLRTSAQALWCGVAGDVLASSIRIPPMSDETGDQDFYVRLLPHVNQVRLNKEEIESQLWQNRAKASYMRGWVWSNRLSSFTTLDALNSVKYSRIYLECFRFDEAEKLQRNVLEFVVTKLGRENQFVVPISMALSKTLWLLAKAAEAQELQEDALRICRAKLGKTHSQTLKAMDALGETYWQRGWLREAKALHEAVIDGMQGKPDLKRDRLKAFTHLGHVHEWYTEFERAQELHEEASTELTNAYGADDFDTLVAKDSLAMTLLQFGTVEHTKRAYNLMHDIYQRRLKTLGEEHLYTLWAACNLARTLTARGSLEQDSNLIQEAKALYNDGLAITRRNLGPDHLGTLMGRAFYGEALVAEKNYDQAEKEFKDIAERQRTLPGSRAGTHRDRLVTLQRLVDCYETRGRFQEAVDICTTIIQELDGMGGQQHPWRVKILERREKLSIIASGRTEQRSPA